MNNTFVCSLLFATVEDCQILLTAQLENLREKSGLTCSDLNHDCHLGVDLPLYEEVVHDPTLCTPAFLEPVLKRLNINAGQLLHWTFRHHLDDPECAQKAFARCEQRGVSPWVFTLYQEPEWDTLANSILKEIDEVAPLLQMA